MKLSKRVLMVAVLTLGAASAVRADWLLTTADFSTAKKVTVNEWNLKESLSYSMDNASLAQVQSRTVVSLASDKLPKAATDAWRVTLRNRDVLVGSPTGTHDQNLQFTTRDAGAVEIPLKNVATIDAPDAPVSAGATLAGAASSDQDSVKLKNGDTIAGIVATISADKISMSAAGNDNSATDIPLAKVTRLTLGGANVPRTVPPLSARLTLINGSTLTTTDFSWRLDELTFNDPSGASCKVPLANLLSVEILGGRVVYLTELDAAKDEQVSTFGTGYPTQLNRSAAGAPLKLEGTTYPRGFGVHAKSVLAFDLDGSFESLIIRGGVDDSAAPYGEVDASIVADGKTIWHGEGLMATTLSQALTLPLNGAKHLELHVDPANHLDVQGRFDWVGAALVRP